MDEQLRQRRKRTWELLIVMGVDYRDVVQRIASEYGCAEGTVKADINRMEDWLPKLSVMLYSGVSRLTELREGRQRLRQYQMQARQDEDIELAQRIQQKIDRNIELENRMAQRLGFTHEEPHKLEIPELDPEDKELIDEWCNVESGDVDLEDMR